jgi:signal transduction histidine kinase
MFARIRRRLTLWNALVVLVLLAAIEGINYGVLTVSFNRAVESELHARLAQQLAIAGRMGVATLAARNAQRLEYDLAYPGVFALVTDGRGRVIAAPAGLRALALPDQAALARALAGQVDERTVERGARDVRLLSAPVRAGGRVIGAVQVGRSMTLHERELALLLQVALLGGGVGLVLALGCGLFLAGRALVPVRAAFAAQRTFIADASHELRTPLALLRGTAEMLQHRFRRDPQRDRALLADMLADCDQLQRLIEDLLTLARADVGQLIVHPKPVQLDQLIGDACRRALVLAEPRGIRLTWTLPGTTVAEVDPTWLAQLTWILLENALAYTEPGGTVQVGLTTAARHALLTVADTGIGIPPAHLPHIFDRFYRVDPARTRDSGGAGLGLAIARVIAEAHGGAIGVESREGAGSVFTVRLPLSQDRDGTRRIPLVKQLTGHRAGDQMSLHRPSKGPIDSKIVSCCQT